jgi:hypothetical protein
MYSSWSMLNRGEFLSGTPIVVVVLALTTLTRGLFLFIVPTTAIAMGDDDLSLSSMMQWFRCMSTSWHHWNCANAPCLLPSSPRHFERNLWSCAAEAWIFQIRYHTIIKYHITLATTNGPFVAMEWNAKWPRSQTNTGCGRAG